MEKIKPRPYQEGAVNSSLSEFENHRSLLIEMPTGTGKTIVFSILIERWIEKYPESRILVLAHRYELLEQAQTKLEKVTGIHAGMEKASIKAKFSDEVVIASVQSMKSKKRMARYDPDSFDLIIVDEAHHAAASSYRKIIDHFADAKVLGVTATPDRSDKLNLGSVFEKVAFRYELSKAIQEGYLCPIKCHQVPLKIDLQEVKTKAGDYDDSALDSAIRPYFESIVKSMKEECSDRKTVVFLPLVQSAVDFSQMLNEAGFRSASISGKTPAEERKQILKDFEDGKYNVLCNAMLLTEGWDCPSVDCIVPLRPTKSRSLFSQIVGRGLRLSPGKKELKLLDYLWITNRTHKLTKKTKLRRMKDLFIEQDDFDGWTKDEIANEVDKNLPPSMASEREAIIQQILEENSTKEKMVFDPLETKPSSQDNPYHYFWMINQSITQDYSDKEKPTKAQVSTLKKIGIKADGNMSKKIADKIIRTDVIRGRKHLTTYKQIRLLRQKGFKNVEKWDRSDASNLISQIKDNGWKVPSHIHPATYKPSQNTFNFMNGFHVSGGFSYGAY